ncbi:MAG TPA: Na-translocating system protein MpsC family protein [Acidimicrobiales bacterium]|nr:Na-translocating system protein MpsC family protein [Acidimicrobiales bacterium]
MPTESEHLRGGELNAAITSAIVGIQTKHLGRGPSHASTAHSDQVITVIMRDVMTRAEKALVQTGERHAVMNMRQLLQEAMESDFKAAVERLTGRKVLAFVSGNHVDPDIAVETFILDHPPAAA